MGLMKYHCNKLLLTLTAITWSGSHFKLVQLYHGVQHEELLLKQFKWKWPFIILTCPSRAAFFLHGQVLIIREKSWVRMAMRRKKWGHVKKETLDCIVKINLFNNNNSSSSNNNLITIMTVNRSVLYLN